MDYENEGVSYMPNPAGCSSRKPLCLHLQQLSQQLGQDYIPVVVLILQDCCQSSVHPTVACSFSFQY